MINLPLQPKYVVNPVVVIMIALILFYFEPTSCELLCYHRQSIVDGEFWRLFSGNFLHTNFNHLLLNCAGVLLIWLLHAEHFTIKRYFSVLLVCCLGTGIGLYLFTSWSNYVGLSGALHGIIAYGAIKDIKSGEKTGGLLLLGIIIKVGYENVYGASESVQEMIGAKVAVEAHLTGLVTGLMMAVPLLFGEIKEKASPRRHGDTEEMQKKSKT